MVNGSWRNWAGNQGCSPARIERPADTAGVVRAVHDAARDGLTVRAAGSGHSFTPAVATDGVLLVLDRMDRPRGIDPGTGFVTVEAGMTLRALDELLAAAGRALTNMGDIDAQTVAGAVATSTHGTGRDSGSMAAQVRALELVLADGSTVTCSPEAEPDLFAAARVGLGALGVVTAVTLSTEPAFLLHAVEAPERFDDVLTTLDEATRANEHFEFYWFPHTEHTLTKKNNRTTGPPRPLSRARAWFDDVLVANHVFGAACRLGRRVPAAVPRTNRLAGVLLGRREYVDASHRVFTSPRRVRFVEMEYAVPRAELEPVLRELRAAVDRGGWRISFPVEVRVAPADDVWLSTAHGRDTAYVAVHQYVGSRLDGYFDAAERIFAAAAGRPHWGKLHGRGAEHLAPLYSRYGDFLAVRDEVDPHRRFGNAYLTRLFGS